MHPTFYILVAGFTYAMDSVGTRVLRVAITLVRVGSCGFGIGPSRVGHDSSAFNAGGAIGVV